jgi:2-polyprenyl-3-methyl-5-hydroxy-6-metoxy-1,4-benzoquinol methylase
LTQSGETRQAKLDRAANMKWFHALDFGDCQSAGRFPEGTPQNVTLYGVMDLLPHVEIHGKKCVDVGTAHGLCAFNMASRGGSVVATDVFDGGSKPFNVARDLLGLDVDYRSNVHFGNILDEVGQHRFDVMVCAGVMYHMLNPFDCVLKARKLLKPNGILVLETAFLHGKPGAYIDFNPVSAATKEIYTYWTPTKDSVLGMLRLTGFDVLAVRTIKKPDRIAVVARSVPVDQVRDRPEITRRLHDAGIWDPVFPEIETDAPEATVAYTGPTDDLDLDWRSFTPDFYPHPSTPKPVLGRTTWMAEKRNY